MQNQIYYYLIKATQRGSWSSPIASLAMEGLKNNNAYMECAKWELKIS
jgi:hypothetical protein